MARRKKIGAAKGVAGEILGDAHHLFLVDDDAVGFGEDRLQHRVEIFRIFAPMLDVDIARDVVHRSRPVERDHSDDVFETVRQQLSKRIAHARTFQLEHADRFAAAKQVIGRVVIKGELRKLELGATLVHEPLAERQHGERRETEKIELDQACLLDVLHIELGHRHRCPRVTIERHQLVQRAVADHDAGRVGRGMARQAFQLLGDIDQLANLLVLLGHLLQPRLQHQRVFEGRRVRWIEGHQLRHLVHLAKRHAERSAGITKDGTGLQLSKGDDRRDLLRAVFVPDVTDHLVPPVLAEIDIKVRHRHAFWIEEALEQKTEAKRIEVGDFKRPGDHRACPRATPGTNWDAARLRVLNKIRDDQEVTFVLHSCDNA